jgi:hypothetical protein
MSRRYEGFDGGTNLRVWCRVCSAMLDYEEGVFGDSLCRDCRRERSRGWKGLTVTERHQMAADAGVDTWEEYRGEV